MNMQMQGHSNAAEALECRGGHGGLSHLVLAHLGGAREEVDALEDAHPATLEALKLDCF